MKRPRICADRSMPKPWLAPAWPAVIWFDENCHCSACSGAEKIRHYVGMSPAQVLALEPRGLEIMRLANGRGFREGVRLDQLLALLNLINGMPVPKSAGRIAAESNLRRGDAKPQQEAV